MDDTHGHLCLFLGSLTLESIGYGASDVQTLHRDPIASIRSGSQLYIVDDIVSNNVFLDDGCVGGGSLFVALARRNELNGAIWVLNQVLTDYQAPVRQDHRHLDVLNQRFVAIDVRDDRNRELFI